MENERVLEVDIKSIVKLGGGGEHGQFNVCGLDHSGFEFFIIIFQNIYG